MVLLLLNLQQMPELVICCTIKSILQESWIFKVHAHAWHWIGFDVIK